MSRASTGFSRAAATTRCKQWLRYVALFLIVAPMAGCGMLASSTLATGAAVGTPVLDRSGTGDGSVPDIGFMAPGPNWTLGWSNSCRGNYAKGLREFNIVGVGTIGNHPLRWYKTHRGELWDQQIAAPAAGIGKGFTTVGDHTGQTYIEINSFCAWRVVVWAGTEEGFCPSLGSTGSLPKAPATPPDLS